MGHQRLASIDSSAVSVTAGTVMARDRLLPLPAPLAGLFPEGGLRRGSTVVIGRGASSHTGAPDTGVPNTGVPGMTSVALALLSEPCTSGSWCAVVGAPDLGLVAAAQAGIDLERLAVIPSPGPKWATVTAALLEGFDIVLLRATGRMGPSDARKLEARARERGAVLAVMGDDWPGSAAVHLEVVAGRWCGLEDGSGHLWGREVEVVASGRGAASRPQRAKIWFGQPELGLTELGPPELEPPELEPPELEPPARFELVAGGAAEVPASIGIAG